MSDKNKEEELNTKEYFKKIQGEDRPDPKKARVSSVTPAEYLQKEREYKQHLKSEENKIKKSKEIMRVCFIYIATSLCFLFVAFMGIAWLLPLFSMKFEREIAQIIITLPFIILGILGIIFMIIGMIKFFNIKTIVESPSDW